MRKVYLINKETDEIYHEIDGSDYLREGSEVTFRPDFESTLSLVLDYDDASLVGENTSFIVKDSKGNMVEFDVEESENTSGQTVTFYCIPTVLSDLGMGQPISSGKEYSNVSSREFYNRVLTDTRYEIGEIDYINTQTIFLEESKFPLEVINEYNENNKVIGEVDLYLDGGRINKRVINFTISEEYWTGKEFNKEVDLLSYKVKEVRSDLATAIMGEARVPQEDDEDLVIREYLYNDEVLERIGGEHRWAILESDAENADDLREEISLKLDELSSIQESFEVDVEDLSDFLGHQKVFLGDFVYIKDSTVVPQLILGGRVSEERINLIDESDRQYLVGDLRRVRSEYDEMRRKLDRYGKVFSGLLREMGEIRRRFVEIQDPEEEPENVLTPEDMVHINILEFSNIRTDNYYEDVDFYNYDYDLRIKGRSTGIGESTSSGRLGISEYEIERPNPYTFHFKVRTDRDCSINFQNRVSGTARRYLISVYKDGARVEFDEKPGNYDLWVDVKGGVETTFDFVMIESISSGNRNDKVRLSSSMDLRFDREVEFEFNEFIKYKGTFKYSLKDRMRPGFIVAPDNSLEYNNTYLEDGSVRVRSDGLIGNGLRDYLRILAPNNRFDGNIVRIKFKVRINKMVGSRSNRLYDDLLMDETFDAESVFSLSSFDLSSRSTVRFNGSEAMMEDYLDTTNTTRSYLITSNGRERTFPQEAEVEMFFPMKLSEGTNSYVRFGSYTLSRIEGMDFEVRDIRLYDGMPPAGVTVEGELEDRVSKIEDELDAIMALINEKADRYHTHSMSDIDGLSDALREKAEVDHSHVIEDVEGLSTELVGKSDVGHQHVQSDIEGLVDRLEDHEQRLIDGGL